MAITFVAAGANGDNGAAGSGNPAAPGIPAGMAAGDFMLLVVHSADNVTTSTPSGWTFKQAQNAGTALRQTIFWRRWQSGDGAPTIAHTAGDACQARIYGYRGVSTTAADPIEAIATQTGTASATVTAATITTLSDNVAVVGCWGMEVTGNTSGTPTWASYSGTNPTFAEIGDNAVDNLNANELSAGIAWGTCTPAGTATGTRTAVVSTAAATPTNNIGTLLALTPAVASGAGLVARIPNRMVGPMALRYRFRQPEHFGYPAGPQTFLQELDATASSSVTLLKQVNKILSATSGSTPSIQKQANKFLSIAAAPSSATMQRQANKLLTVSGSTTASIQRQVNKVLTVSAASAASITKTVTKTLTTSVSSTATLNAVFQAASSAVARLRTLMGVGQ